MFKSLRIIGDTIAAIALTNKIFAVLLPTMFPIAISGAFTKTASILTVSSARLVPKPIITALTKIADKLNLFAKANTPFKVPTPPI